MLIVLSPAKSLDYESAVNTDIFSTPVFLEEAESLIGLAQKLKISEISELMNISPALAQLNAERFSAWRRKPHPSNIRQAIFAFNGDVYEGLRARELGGKEVEYLQGRLRILSGLYGALKPLDALQAYRLEMGTRFANPHGKNLYAFWGDKVTGFLNQSIKESKAKTLLNLASEEYFKVVKPALLHAEVITPVFQDWKNGRYKVISFYAKRARGLMARYCAEHGIVDVRDLKRFHQDSYEYCEEESDSAHWIFRRRLVD
jgi:cytoplasmic iron level regulating protein YaaA (DUF328/UPF0246 family)